MIHGIVAQGAASLLSNNNSFGSHRYWRILIYSGAPNQINISEIRLLREGINQATGGTTIHNGESSGFPASNVFDGVLTSRWVSSAAVSPKPETPLWIGYDFGIAKEIDALSIHSHLTTSGPRDFFLQYSDDNVTWTDAFEVRNQLNWTAGETRIFDQSTFIPDPDAHRFWRLNVTAANGFGGISVARIEYLRNGVDNAVFYNNDTGPSTTFFNGSFHPRNAYDTDLATRHLTNGFPTLTQFDFGVGFKRAVDQVALTGQNQSNQTASPRDFTVQWSDDGTNWTTVLTVTNQTGWTTSERRVFDIP